jgi:hypothetical protein
MKLDDYLMRQAFADKDWSAAISNLAQHYSMLIPDTCGVTDGKEYLVQISAGEEESISIYWSGMYAVWSSSESYMGCVALTRPLAGPAIRIYCSEAIPL